MKIGIIGLGLIGGSLALDFRAKGHKVYGVSRSQRTCDIALQNGVVDFSSCHPEILDNLDVVFLCSPIGSIASVFDRVRANLSPRTVVTDVGSVKGEIVSVLHSQWPHFIGGHPMAGTAQSGIGAAQSNLFEGRPYVLTPVEDTSELALTTLKVLIRELGSQLYTATPHEHDKAVALISHLPIMISAALIATCTDRHDAAVLALAQALASSGFRDTSRVGGGNPELGVMVAQFNREALLRSLNSYEKNIQSLRTLIETQDWPQLEALLAATKRERPNFVQDVDS